MSSQNNLRSSFDVAIVGAGVFGAWSALTLSRAGQRVVLLDGHGPANRRASSGGESRIIRMGYGADEIYTRSARRAFESWKEFIADAPHDPKEDAFFHRTGVLWLAHEGDPYVRDTKAMLDRMDLSAEELTRAGLERRYPQINFAEISWGLLEPDSGALMAKKLVRAVVEKAITEGVAYGNEEVTPLVAGARKLPEILTASGQRITAQTFIFACGPWLPSLFPDLLGNLIYPTRQETFLFDIAGDDRFGATVMPAWIDFHELIYAIPDLGGRGLKIAIDRHGPHFDPETGDRTVSEEGLSEARRHLARRLPGLRDAPLLDAKVCQYENTSNGDFLIDRHPDFENVWLVGGGSGHGFKHGPAVGEYVAGLLTEGSVTEPRFSLGTKSQIRQRSVF